MLTPAADGNSRKKTQSEKSNVGEWGFYVSLAGASKSVWVEVGVSRFGNKYLRTDGDDDTRNNLLSLPECS